MEDFKTELKAKLDNKIDKEYEDLLADLRNSTPQAIKSLKDGLINY